MDNVKGVLLLLTLVLACTTFIFFLQASTAKIQVKDALVANQATRELLKVQGVSCSATSGDFLKIASCIAPLLQQKDFKEDGFSQPDEKKNTQGYLVIKNINRKAYEAEKFTLLYNREREQQGCTIKGEIGYNVVCRFNFARYCEKGSVLEVLYATSTDVGVKDVKLFTKNC